MPFSKFSKAYLQALSKIGPSLIDMSTINLAFSIIAVKYSSFSLFAGTTEVEHPKNSFNFGCVNAS
jgi:hypothetical protein